MKTKELRQMNKEQLKEKLHELKQERLKTLVQLSTGTNPKSPSHVKNVRKTIARVQTIIKSKEEETKQ